MAKKNVAKAATTKTPPAKETTSQGRAVVLPDGTRRVDYIRDQYYNKAVTRSDIRKALNEMYKGQKDAQDIPYQIVFAATKLSQEDYKAGLKTKADEVAKAKADAKVAAKAA